MSKTTKCQGCDGLAMSFHSCGDLCSRHDRRCKVCGNHVTSPNPFADMLAIASAETQGDHEVKPRRYLCPDHWHCNPKLAAHSCDLGRRAPDRARPCPSCGQTPRPLRREVAYLRFLLLDHHRAEEGRRYALLWARFGRLVASRHPAKGHDERHHRANGAAQQARRRHDALSRLCERAREIARRLGAFDKLEGARG